MLSLARIAVLLFRRSRNFCIPKNEPWKSNANGIVGKPAAPTAAPGGSADAAALAVVAVVAVVAGVVDEPEAAATAAVCVATVEPVAGGARAGSAEPPEATPPR